MRDNLRIVWSCVNRTVGRGAFVPRRARIVLPGFPYHVTHRGNRRGQVFFTDDYRRHYLHLVAKYAERFALEVWAYCLMNNHVHLLVRPRAPDSLARTICAVHGTYAQSVNKDNGWSGHAWANRFFSTVLDNAHLWVAVRYIELNPVRAGLVKHAEDFLWSSARAHVSGACDPVLYSPRPFPGPIADWSAWLAAGVPEASLELLRRNTATGRPSVGDGVLEELEKRLGRSLRPRPPGRPPRIQN